MLIGPAAARPGGQSTGAGGYADLLNLKTMTVPSLAFAAAVVRPFRGYNLFSSLPHMSLQTRYALSIEPTCRWVLKSNSPGFNNLAFYQRIISTVESWGEEEQRSLLLWWNRYAALPFLSEPSSPAIFLTTTQQHGPLAPSWGRSCDVPQQRSCARFRGRDDASTSSQRECWSRLSTGRVFSYSIHHYRLYSSTCYEWYWFFVINCEYQMDSGGDF